ncbi:MAG: zf-HC2 domain-containing protein [Anaerolineales bacterium]
MSGQKHCHDLIETLSDYVDGNLNPVLCEELERHLRECPNCRIVVNTLRKTIELYQKEAQEETLPDDVRERLFRRLDLTSFLK